jgi:hypothetical protein
MARHRNNGGNGSGPGAEYVKLEQRLLLAAWLNRLLGYDSNQELLADVKQSGEGFDPYGQSHVYHRLIGRGDKLKVPLNDLGRYDKNIRSHLAAINKGRPEPITLRYFQHLALLYTEIFLDWRFRRPGELLRTLNEFVDDRNARKPYGEPKDGEFVKDDLNKLAYWMATGGGKTLIMHVNYRQFLHYNRKGLENILLITPNEGLTEQHLAEMTLSGIRCRRFSLGEGGLERSDREAVRVIEITKLVQEKRGGGVSVPVEAFEGNNLIFVDEGHKGSGGEAWRKFRDALGQTGFTFEYSATFGQALTAARNDELTAEYGKVIVFDYSYKYFHCDGYGKDFHILNLRDEVAEEQTDLLLLGNLLSFYEQQRCFDEQAEHLRPYNLDRPLWVFVGSSVNAVYTEGRRRRSDVLTVARFLHGFLSDKPKAVKAIEKIVEGNTGLTDPAGLDVFAGRFEYLRRSRQQPEGIYRRVLSSVFHVTAGGALHLCDIRGRSGELGLKVGEAENYFGLIYIGDTTTFKKLVEEDQKEDESGIKVEEDVIGDSLFDGINEPDTSINVLIGAKKFMEGWNSWRVSNMGLLNIGRTEGSEIIQLFGRGVRLRGRGLSLKRSGALDGQHPAHINLLETLNIFAVRANYMAQFREYLQREGVETEGGVELPLEIRPNKEFLGEGLLVPRLPAGRAFAAECDVVLVPDKAARVSVDMSMKVESMRSVSGKLATVAMKAGQVQVIPAESLLLVDWEAAYVDLLEFKEAQGYTNMALTPDMPRKVMEHDEPRLYGLVADQAIVKPRSFAQTAVLQDTVLTILRKYVEKYYRLSQERWATEAMEYRELSKEDGNFQNYTVRVSRRESKLIEAVERLIKEADRVYRDVTTELPTLHFDRHLYQPLLVKDRGGVITSEPPCLEPSERQFVEDIRRYWAENGQGRHAGQHLFLLRNLSRGEGVGFYLTEGFFPDFILWIKEGDRQRIVFVEPHGMLMAKTYWSDDKARLHERLAELSEKWGNKAGVKNVVLDSFIISATPYRTLRDYCGDSPWSVQDFTDRHILFFDNADYTRTLFG